MGRRPHKHPGFASAKIKRMQRDISDESRYNELAGDEDSSDNPLLISVSGDNQNESMRPLRS
jgi:hypothetical protein